MNELDFSDNFVQSKPSRIAPALKRSQTKTYKKAVRYTRRRLQEIENRLEEKRLEEELREAYDL